MVPDHQNINKNLDQQGTEELSSSPTKLSASQKAKQKQQKAQADKLEKHLITHNKDKFQEYSVKKGQNYQPKGKQVETSDLQFCLSMYTDLDVLDEDNKFICQACTKQNQCMFIDYYIVVSMYIYVCTWLATQYVHKKFSTVDTRESLIIYWE